MASQNDTTGRSAPDGPTPDADRTSPATSGAAPSSEQRTEAAREYQGTGIIWSAVALVVAIALFVIIALQNTHDVEFEFLWFEAATPLSLIVAITFGLALVLGEVIGFVWRHRRRTRLRERDELRRLRKGS